MGFDESDFFFDRVGRDAERKSMGLGRAEVLVGTFTRLVPNKGIERFIDSIAKIRDAGHGVRYLLVGGMGDAYEQDIILETSRAMGASLMTVRPFADHATLRRLMCACDIGIWNRPAITIQESMGTGMRVLLHRKPAVSHLLGHGTDEWVGEYFSEEGLEEVLMAAVKRMEARTEEERVLERTRVAGQNLRHLGYSRIAMNLLNLE